MLPITVYDVDIRNGLCLGVLKNSKCGKRKKQWFTRVQGLDSDARLGLGL